MHIPTSPTTYIDVLPFEEALTEALNPHPDYEVNDWEGEHRGNADEGYAIHGEDIHLHLNNNEEDNDD